MSILLGGTLPPTQSWKKGTQLGDLGDRSGLQTDVGKCCHTKKISAAGPSHFANARFFGLEQGVGYCQELCKAIFWKSPRAADRRDPAWFSEAVGAAQPRCPASAATDPPQSGEAPRAISLFGSFRCPPCLFPVLGGSIFIQMLSLSGLPASFQVRLWPEGLVWNQIKGEGLGRDIAWILKWRDPSSIRIKTCLSPSPRIGSLLVWMATCSVLALKGLQIPNLPAKPKGNIPWMVAKSISHHRSNHG